MNASLVEEATAAATSMANQAAGLARAVAQFRVDEHGGGDSAPAAMVSASLPRQAQSSTQSQGMVAQRREPALTGGEEDWKEF
jgi:hypothetical protein